MPRFFISGDNILGNTVKITGSDAAHIARSLRMATGDAITVCDMQRRSYACRITGVTPELVSAEITGTFEADNEPPFHAVLYQAVPKGDKAETIVQKAVELGAGEINFFDSEHCVGRIRPDALESKLTRFNRIALEAAKQCGRSELPRVGYAGKYADALRGASEGGLGFICYEGADTLPLRRLLRESAPATDIRFIIGPEGGFSLGEIEQARLAGLAVAGLGQRILRCETASAFVLSCLVYENELG